MKAPVPSLLVRYTAIALLLSSCTILSEPSSDQIDRTYNTQVDSTSVEADLVEADLVEAKLVLSGSAQTNFVTAIQRVKALTPQTPFIPHTSPTPFGRYVAMNIPFEPVYQLNRKLFAKFGRELIDRGEAHITVVTPPEYERLAPYIDIHELNEFFAPTLQTVVFNGVCIGQGQKEIDTIIESTYFVVVESDQLEQLRKRVARRYIERGGQAPAFEQAFYPHITIGFTRRDLHASDGVLKSASTCLVETL